MLDIQAIVDELNQQFHGALKLSEDGKAVIAAKEDIKPLLAALKEKHGYKALVDITAVDFESHYEVVYHLMRLADADVLRLKAALPAENPVIASVTGVWKAADVMEREVFDLMGLVFAEHGNLKRILCPDNFKGHPLRKEFKLNTPSRF